MTGESIGLEQKRKIHPQQFAMWLAIGSISMMFAGLTSAYIVRQAQGNWRIYTLPDVFFYSTVVILLSSITYFFSIRFFKKREMPKFHLAMRLTLVLGLLFGLLQYIGFYQLLHFGQKLNLSGQVSDKLETVRLNGNPSESFLYIIAGLHLIHVLGGLIAMTIVYLRMNFKKSKVYDATGLITVGSYWHFMDILWIYLFIFFLVNR